MSLHLGIAITLQNSALLSFVTCVPWFTFWPSWELLSTENSDTKTLTSAPQQQQSHSIISTIIVLSLITGSLWFEIWLANDCQTESQQHICSTLLHDRWNVVIVAEEYVTWTSC